MACSGRWSVEGEYACQSCRAAQIGWARGIVGAYLGSTFRTAEPDLTKLLEQVHAGELQLPVPFAMTESDTPLPHSHARITITFWSSGDV